MKIVHNKIWFNQ